MRNRREHARKPSCYQPPGEHVGDAEPGKRAVALPGTVTYEKPRDGLTDNEKAGVDGLAENGISPTVKPEDPTALANIDLVIDGEPWEMKNVTNISSSSNQVKRARIKWMKLGIETPMKAVFTTEGATIPFAEICDTLSRRRREGETFIVLSQERGLVWLQEQ